MTQVNILHDLDIILPQVVFWICVGFVGAVSLIWPWWRTDLGWNIVLKTACIGMLLLNYNLHLIFGISYRTVWWHWFNDAMFLAVGVIIVWRFIVLWVIQKYDPPPTKSGRASYGSVRRIRQGIRRRDKENGSPLAHRP